MSEIHAYFNGDSERIDRENYLEKGFPKIKGLSLESARLQKNAPGMVIPGAECVRASGGLG